MSNKSIPCITLTSDFGLKDYYVAATKGAIINQFEKNEFFNIVDISHQIEPFHVAQAAYIIGGAYHNFPKGTVHCIGISTGLQRQVAAYYNGHYFLCEDNGLLSIIFNGKPDAIVEINRIQSDGTSPSFVLKDIYPKAACHLARGGAIELLGTRTDKYEEKLLPKPNVFDDIILGQIIYIDRIGNAICNISKSVFNEHIRGRKFHIIFSLERNQIDQISKQYSDVPIGEKVAIFNDLNQMEIAINLGSNANSGGASQLFGLKVGSTVRIEFYVD